ncbi:MAG: FHA domain-containing protein [Myxacorys californica WJT36-NPBG1]|jgi:pSer/pThr/pTyr-binding forkhead associated (FHA) protein|nr:FHA domain-containing protein [Myxacorys californica WJT36-NPBG1]
MAIRNSQLLTHIQELKQLIAEDFCQSQFFQQIDQDLDQIIDDLGSEKLAIHFLSSDRDLANSFHRLLNPNQDLEQKYQFRFHELPNQLLQKQKSVRPAFLVLQPLENEVKQTRYTLSLEGALIGREPECDIYIPDHYTCVSGRHLEVHGYSTNDHGSPDQWQVQNCADCRNGTYINGELLVGKHILESGDRIVLGDRLSSSKSPQLMFECPPISDEISIEANYNPYRRLVNCDILFLVVDSKGESLEAEKILHLVSVNAELKAFLITSIYEPIEVFQVTQQEKFPISLEALNQQLASITEKQNSSTKLQRILSQTILITTEVSQVFSNKKEKLEQEIEKVKAQQLQGHRKSIEDVSLLSKAINEQKIGLLRAIESSVSHAKQDLLDDFLADSILQKIQELVDSLEAQIFKQEGKKYLELRAKGVESNVNDFIVQFCESELLKWVDEEWRKILKEYGNGGLESLVESSNRLLKKVCANSNKDFTVKIKRRLELEGAFQASLRRIPVRIEYQQEPAWIYFFKRIRGSVFQVMGILFLFSFLGVSRPNIIRTINKQISGSLFLSIVVLGIITCLTYNLYKSYQKNRDLEIHKSAEKIRQDLKNYYYRVVKNHFVERIVQRLETQLKEEINSFDESIKAFLDITSRSSVVTNHSQVDTKSYLRDCQDQTKRLEKKLGNLQRIKDKLQRLQSR